MAMREKFYKYQPLTETEHFSRLENFLSQKIYFPLVSQFNDPFEGNFKFVNDIPDLTARQLKENEDLLRQQHKAQNSKFTFEEMIDNISKDPNLEIMLQKTKQG